MTTTVTITAHNNPCRVTVMDRLPNMGKDEAGFEYPTSNGIVNGYTKTLRDGEAHETHVTDSRTVIVEELPRG